VILLAEAGPGGPVVGAGESEGPAARPVVEVGEKKTFITRPADEPSAKLPSYGAKAWPAR